MQQHRADPGVPLMPELCLVGRSLGPQMEQECEPCQERQETLAVFGCGSSAGLSGVLRWPHVAPCEPQDPSAGPHRTGLGSMWVCTLVSPRLAPHGVIPALEQPGSSSLWLSSLFSPLRQRDFSQQGFIQCWAALLEPPGEEPVSAVPVGDRSESLPECWHRVPGWHQIPSLFASLELVTQSGREMPK